MPADDLVKCEYCGKKIGLCNYSRWHGKKCVKAPLPKSEFDTHGTARVFTDNCFKKSKIVKLGEK